MAEHIRELAGFSSAHNSRARLHSLIVPREHGAWGMLLVPLATGAAVALLTGGNASFLSSLIIAAITIFWLRTPVESWLGSSPLRAQSLEERSAVLQAILALALTASVALADLFWDGRHLQLLWLGAASGSSFAAQAGLKKLGRSTRVLAQIVGAIGLTSTAPAAYYVAAGHMNSSALLLWLSNWLFAVNQIQFVQLRLHSARVDGIVEKLARGRAFLAAQSGVAVMLLIAWYVGLLPWLVLVAFVPVWVRGATWLFRAPDPLAVRRLGWTELANGVTFGILLVLGFYFRA